MYNSRCFRQGLRRWWFCVVTAGIFLHMLLCHFEVHGLYPPRSATHQRLALEGLVYARMAFGKDWGWGLNS